MATNNLKYRRAGGLSLLLLGAFWLGSTLAPRMVATAEAQQSAGPEPFLTGDERALPIQREILATLKQIDERLERMEKLIPSSRQP